MVILSATTTLISSAWSHQIEPMGRTVSRSAMDEENHALVREFGEVSDWRDVPAAVLDQAPAGLASALSFFSDEAIQYFIAGYLVADLEGELHQVEPLFALVHGFDGATYGKTAEADPASEQRWRGLSPEQVKAIVSYLEAKREDEIVEPQASAALDAYWYPRLRTLQ
jgi:hypothetical protein